MTTRSAFLMLAALLMLVAPCLTFSMALADCPDETPFEKQCEPWVKCSHPDFQGQETACKNHLEHHPGTAHPSGGYQYDDDWGCQNSPYGGTECILGSNQQKCYDEYECDWDPDEEECTTGTFLRPEWRFIYIEDDCEIVIIASENS